MTDERITRILVALDASQANQSTLHAAMALASKLNAQLQALFVEDINLLRLAELPFAREVSASTHLSKKLNIADMEKQLSGQVQRLRRIVDAAAQQSNMQVEFKVLRGQISSELCTAVQQMDLLVVGKNTQLLRHSEKLGNITRDMLLSTKCSILLLQHGASLERPVALIHTGSKSSRRALQLAMQLALGDNNQLTVFYPAIDNEQQRDLQQQVNTMTQPLGIDAVHVPLAGNSAAAILKALHDYKSRLLLLNPEQSLLDEEQLQTLISQCQTPVILVR